MNLEPRKILGPLEVWKPQSLKMLRGLNLFGFDAVLLRPPKIEPVEALLFQTTPVLEQRPFVLALHVILRPTRKRVTRSVPLSFCNKARTRCAPVPSRFLSSCPYYNKTRNDRLVVTQGRDGAPVPSRFLSSCRSYTQL